MAIAPPSLSPSDETPAWPGRLVERRASFRPPRVEDCEPGSSAGLLLEGGREQSQARLAGQASVTWLVPRHLAKEARSTGWPGV